MRTKTMSDSNQGIAPTVGMAHKLWDMSDEEVEEIFDEDDEEEDGVDASSGWREEYHHQDVQADGGHTDD